MSKLYMVVRKVDHYRWIRCCLWDNRRIVKGGRTTDKALADKNRDALAKDFPEHVYAVLEITE